MMPGENRLLVSQHSQCVLILQNQREVVLVVLTYPHTCCGKVLSPPQRLKCIQASQIIVVLKQRRSLSTSRATRKSLAVCPLRQEAQSWCHL